MLDSPQTPRHHLIRELREAQLADMTLPPPVDPAAAAAQEEHQPRQQQLEEESTKLAAEEAKNVQSVWEAQRVCRLEACRAVLLDHKISPLSADNQVALKEHDVKLKLPSEAYLNRYEQKLRNLITSKMLSEKLLKLTEEMLAHLPGPDRTLLEQMRPADCLMRTQSMLEEIVNTACEQVVYGASMNRVLQKLQEAFKDYIDTITLLADTECWDKEKLMYFKSEAQDGVRSAKEDLKKV